MQTLYAESQTLHAESQTQHAVDMAKIADAIKATSSNLGLPPDVLPPNKYPKIDEFKLSENSGDEARLTFFAFRNQISHRHPTIIV